MNTYKRHRFPPDIISYAVWLYYRFTLRELMPDVFHDTSQYANNRAEQCHESTRVRERGMRGTASRKFKSTGQAQRFLTAHAAVCNLFTLRVQAILAGTWYRQATIVISGSVRFQIGAGQLRETRQIFAICQS